MKKMISFLSSLLILGTLLQSSVAAQCIAQTYLHKIPHKTGDIAIDELKHFTPILGKTKEIIATVSHKKVGAKRVAFLNEYNANDGSLKNSIRIQADSYYNYYGVDLIGKGKLPFSGFVSEYYVLANTSLINDPNNFGGVALFRLGINSAGVPTLLWETRLGHTTIGSDPNNKRDNKAVALEPLDDGGVLVIGNKIDNTTGCTKPFVTRVDLNGNVVFQKFYGDCNLWANGSTIAEVNPQGTEELLAITGEKRDPFGDKDIFVMLINRATGDLSWIKSYFSSTAPDDESGRSITSYSNFSPGTTQATNRLVITADRKGPNDPFPVQELIVFQVETLTGDLKLYREYEVFDGMTKLQTHGLVIRKDFQDKIVVGGRLFYPGPNGNQHPFLLHLEQDGSIHWMKTYLDRDIITEHIDMIPSQSGGCDFLNMVAIGEGTSWLPDFHSVQFRTDAHGNLLDPYCMPMDVGVNPIDAGIELELQKVVLDFIDFEGFPSAAYPDNFTLLDCDEYPVFGGFPGGFKLDTEEELSTSSWNLAVSPNPVNDVMDIRFDLEAATVGRIEIFNVQGQLVHQMPTLDLNKGENKIRFDTKILSSGIYFCKVLTSDKTETIRFVKSK